MATGSKRRRGEAWELRVYAGLDRLTGTRRYVTTTMRGSEREADRALRRLVDEVEDGRGAPDAGRTFRSAADRWLAMARPDMSPSTVMTTEDYLRRYLHPTLGSRPVDRIGTEDLDALYGQLRTGGPTGRPLAPATIVRVHGIAHRVLEQARRWRWVSRNVADDATPPRIARRKATTPAAAEVARFLTWVGERDQDFALYLRLAAIVGARRAELCALRWSAIDLDRGAIAITSRLVAGRDADGHERVVELVGTKANPGRTVALDPETVHLLTVHRKVCADRASACGVTLAPDGFVFSLDPSAVAGWKPHSVTQRFRRLRTRAGLGTVRLHDIRHYVASHLLDAGIGPASVADRVGQSPRTTLGIYAQGVTETDRRSALLLADALRPAED